MVAKKISSFMVLFFFMSQIVFPSYSFSNVSGDSNAIQYFLANGELFYESVDKSDELIIKKYVEFINEQLNDRKELNNIYEELNTFLVADDFWDNLNINSEPFSKLLLQANESKNYIVKETIPVDRKFLIEELKLRLTMNEYIKKTQNEGRVPDGFLETARQLELQYSVHDMLWVKKEENLQKISSIRETIYKNYVTKAKKVSPEILSNLNYSINTLNLLLNALNKAKQKIEAINSNFKLEIDKFNSDVKEKLSEEKRKTQSLIVEIQKQIDFLTNKAGVNERNHATLLQNIVPVLENRIGIIDAKFRGLSNSGADSNFLFFSYSSKDESINLIADEFKVIVTAFINKTGNKLELIKKLNQNISELKKSLQEELTIVNEMLDASSLTDEEKRVSKSKAIYYVNDFTEIVTTSEDYIKNVVINAEEIQFDSPDVVMSNIDQASKVLNINKYLENFLLKSENIGTNSYLLDFQLAELLLPISDKELKQNNYYIRLNDISSLRSKSVSYFDEGLEQLKKSSQADFELLNDLRELSVKVIYVGEKKISEQVESLGKIIGNNTSLKGKPYYDYLKAAYETISKKHKTLDTIQRLIKEKDSSEKIEALNKYNVWQELSFIGPAFTDIFQQLNDVSIIDEYYSKDKILSNNVYQDALNLFGISNLLRKPPILKLHNDSIDLIFQVGTRIVVIKGIGNPSKIDLSGLNVHGDILLNTPYIGWGFNPIAAFNEGVSKIIDVVVSSKEALCDFASDVISNAKEVGGKIITKTAEIRDGISQVVTKAAKSTGKFISDTLDVLGDIGSNTWKNFILDEEGEISWWKVGGLALHSFVCIGTGVVVGAVTVVAGGVAAAGACFNDLIAGSIVENFTKGLIDTVAMKENGALISEKNAEFGKSLFDYATNIGVTSALKVLNDTYDSGTALITDTRKHILAGLNNSILDWCKRDSSLKPSSEFIDEVLPYAKISQAVYEDENSEANVGLKNKGWAIVDSADSIVSGFYARVYKNTITGEAVVALRGTQVLDARDIVTDVNGLIVPTWQHLRALEYVNRVKSVYGEKLVVTGHSLGGGLAQFAAAANDLKAYTFNTASLSLASVLSEKAAEMGLGKGSLKPDNITNVVMTGDPVNPGSKILGAIDLGEKVCVDCGLSGFAAHSIDNFNNCFCELNDVNEYCLSETQDDTESDTSGGETPVIERPFWLKW